MGATPQDEIDKQHGEAYDAIISMKCAPMVDRGEIPLAWKVEPTMNDPRYNEAENVSVNGNSTLDTFQLKNEDEQSRYNLGSCISSRGQVDVSKLISLVTPGCHIPAATTNKPVSELKKMATNSKSNLWDEVNAAKNNAHVVRPSHDAWGIKKIVLMFCDDFLQTVYEMPWWHSNPAMRNAMKPILDALNIKPDRIVRMLFAALPPGTTIPVHHDTGAWVSKTHRVHVPIVVDDPDRIVFRCGPNESSMQRVSCIPGHVFEMNNQAKHAVSNCQKNNKHRVHMILDYVDMVHDDAGVSDSSLSSPSSFRPRRIQLSPGETLLQTRRSIDRALDKSKRPTPSFLIIGAQKAGTTSIYEYLNQHPLVVKARRRETHCLDWRWNHTLNNVTERKKHCLSFFLAKELKFHPSCMTGDSTPSYLLDSYRCIPRLKKVFDHYEDMKYIVMTRDPVKRAKSHYEMVTSLDGTPEQIQARGKEWLKLTFEDVIRLDMCNMKKSGLIPYWDIDREEMDMDAFNAFVGTNCEDEAFRAYSKDHVKMGSGSHSLISRGMYELQLRPWMCAISNKDAFLVMKLETMKKVGVQTTMKKVFEHLNLPYYKVEDESAKNTRSYNEMTLKTEHMLRRFYAPHNARLERLLSDEEWSGDPWVK